MSYIGRMKTPVVVCVDDEPAILAALHRVLRDEPYRLLTTGRPLEAMDWVLAEAADVLIADHRMPDMTGLRLLELAQTCSPSTARVLLSGQSDLLEEPWTSDVVQRVVRKPWDSDELKASIRDLISRV
jgi:response regulator RpfG family c-di-GMP phosphodiesterase